MRGIRLSHGVTFVEHRGITVRIKADGKCEISPIEFDILEWDLRTESPDRWTYIDEEDIDSMGKDVRQQIEDIVSRVYKILNG